MHDELGSSLAGINMGFGLLREKITSPALLKDLSNIQELLTNVSKVARGMIDQLYPTVLDSYGFVAAIEWLTKEFKKFSAVEVELDLPEEKIVMDKTYAIAAYRITQECLTNISKHAQADNVKIVAISKNGFLNLTIHDNGIGMPDKISENRHGVFGMIERARYLGGSLKFGNNLGKGTIVNLILPLVAIKPKNRKRVLVVDDHEILRDAVRQLLLDHSEDFSVAGEAADGQSAINMAIDGEWDIILLDISLPIKNGIEVLEEIKAAKPNLPVIILSSHAGNNYGEIALSKGASAYVEKGETRKLLEVMRRAMHEGTLFSSPRISGK